MKDVVLHVRLSGLDVPEEQIREDIEFVLGEYAASVVKAGKMASVTYTLEECAHADELDGPDGSAARPA